MTTYRTQNEIGNVVTELRNRSGLSQGTVAEALGVDPSAISRIEGGQRALSAVEVVKLAHCLDVPAERILTVDEPMGVLLRAADADHPEIERTCVEVRSVIEDFLGVNALMSR